MVNVAIGAAGVRVLYRESRMFHDIDPVFLPVRDGRIAALASYGLRVPADRT